MVLLFTFTSNCARIIRRSVEGNVLHSRIAPDYASVAQWIEQCPPEACAAVRLRPDVYFLCPGIMLMGLLMPMAGWKRVYKLIIIDM